MKKIIVKSEVEFEFFFADNVLVNSFDIEEKLLNLVITDRIESEIDLSKLDDEDNRISYALKDNFYNKGEFYEDNILIKIKGNKENILIEDF